MRKIIGVYVFGSLLYLSGLVALTVGTAIVEHQDVLDASADIFSGISPLSLLYYGDGIDGPLWFLPALAFSTSIIAVFRWAGYDRYILIPALSFHIVGLLGESYVTFVDIPFKTRDALFFGLFYVSLGYLVRLYRIQPRREKLFLAFSGVFAVANVAERYFLLKAFAIGLSQVFHSDYTLLTPFFTMSVFFFALSAPDFGRDTKLPLLGTLAVGIYVVHLVVLLYLERIVSVIQTSTLGGAELTMIRQFVFTPTVIAISILVYILLGRAGIVGIFYSYEDI